MFSETIKAKYSDIITQNSSISSDIAEKIKMIDLSDNTHELVTQALIDVEKACSQQSTGEKIVSYLPTFIGDRILSYMDKINRLQIKHSNIAEVSTRHFEILSKRRDSVKDNVMSLYDIKGKLQQSIVILSSLKQELEVGVVDFIDSDAPQDKKELLVCKELNIQISSQIAIQQDLINQLDMVDYTACMILDTINQTLPDLQANFIDQISITTTLDNLKKFKDSVDRTRDMIISLQEETFVNTSQLIQDITNNGIGMSKNDVMRLEKLNTQKIALNQKMTQNLIRNSKEMDENLKRLDKLIVSTKNGCFDNLALEHNPITKPTHRIEQNVTIAHE